MPDRTELRQRIIGRAIESVGRINYIFYLGPHLPQSQESGMNCYGWIKWILTGEGLAVPEGFGIHEMWERLPATEEPEAADLFFVRGKRIYPGHTGFYAGPTVIHCSKELGGVAESPRDSFDIVGYRSVRPLMIPA